MGVVVMLMKVPGSVVTVADPLPSTHARMPRGEHSAHVDRAAVECDGRITGPRRLETGMSDQAVDIVGSAARNVDIPRSCR